ncbi:class F sortase [Haloechinothrix halophila]|uniref:class F sortase n=1 Tax=Haloechinothrix halophila TaxID=1069073 RepID=UPI0004023923|nr:class F sortase [Haloechinothrix halophila]
MPTTSAGHTTQPTGNTSATAASKQDVAPMSAADPTNLAIPSLGVTAPIMDLGLQSDGSLEVPPGAEQAGWYTGAPTPGELGPAIIAAHVNWEGEDGPFARLSELTPGSHVVVSRADGRHAVFAVDRVEQYPKTQFPTERVYGDIDHAGLRLITCGGEFDSAADSYRDNIIAFARLVAIER